MSKFEVGNVYSSNKYGDYKIIEKIDYSHYIIQFVNTGYTRTISYSSINEGSVRDPYYPIYYNVAYLGEIDIKEYKKELNVWRFMIERCYNPKHDNYKTYGAIGVRVCDEWLCFANFVNDIVKIKGYDEDKFKNGEIVLDKDIDFDSYKPKMYCLKNCRFVKQSDNFQEMLTRKKQSTSSRYIGVTKLKNGKWQASISYKSKNVYIGRFNTEEDAHEAYKIKHKQLYEELSN